jgi:hypothetical protein
MAHYLRGLVYGGVVFLGGGGAVMVVAFLPGPDGAPNAVRGLRLLANVGIPEWLGYVVGFFALFGLLVTCAELTRWAYRRLVPARCPECGGETYGQGRAPVIYLCRDCGHRHDTGICEGEEAD